MIFFIKTSYIKSKFALLIFETLYPNYIHKFGIIILIYSLMNYDDYKNFATISRLIREKMNNH